MSCLEKCKLRVKKKSNSYIEIIVYVANIDFNILGLPEIKKMGLDQIPLKDLNKSISKIYKIYFFFL